MSLCERINTFFEKYKNVKIFVFYIWFYKNIFDSDAFVIKFDDNCENAKESSLIYETLILTYFDPLITLF